MHHKAFVVSTSPLVVQQAGAASNVPAVCNSDYTPSIGDEVAAVSYDSGLLIICQVTR